MGGEGDASAADAVHSGAVAGEVGGFVDKLAVGEGLLFITQAEISSGLEFGGSGEVAAGGTVVGEVKLSAPMAGLSTISTLGSEWPSPSMA